MSIISTIKDFAFGGGALKKASGEDDPAPKVQVPKMADPDQAPAAVAQRNAQSVLDKQKAQSDAQRKNRKKQMQMADQFMDGY